MTLTQGRPYLAIPGPSVVPDRVLRAMHRASPNIYEGEIIDTTAKALDDLRRIAFSTSHVAIYVGNGHAGWEAANANVFSRGDKALAVITGQFGINWTNSVRRMAVDVEELNFGRRSPADPPTPQPGGLRGEVTPITLAGTQGAMPRPVHDGPALDG